MHNCEFLLFRGLQTKTVDRAYMCGKLQCSFELKSRTIPQTYLIEPLCCAPDLARLLGAGKVQYVL